MRFPFSAHTRGLVPPGPRPEFLRAGPGAEPLHRERPGPRRAAFPRVDEVGFESREEAERTEWKAAMADAATFMDMERIEAGWAEEHQIL